MVVLRFVWFNFMVRFLFYVVCKENLLYMVVFQGCIFVEYVWFNFMVLRFYVLATTLVDGISIMTITRL